MKIFKDEKTEKKEKKSSAKKSVKALDTAKASMKDLYAGETVKTAASTGKKDAKSKAVKRGNAYRILVKPLITEKASHMGAINKYFFAVADSANKIEIADAVLEVYGIKPTAVNVISMLGKQKRSGRISGKRKDWKKAIVTLPKGQTINLYEGV